MANSLSHDKFLENVVVNCFQISNFVLWQTASNCLAMCSCLLWIAFKLVILSYGKQRISWRITKGFVVNCFQISNFVLWQTAKCSTGFCSVPLWIAFKLVILSYGKQPILQEKRFSNELWIAFKLVILSYGKQHMCWMTPLIFCCELLSN